MIVDSGFNVGVISLIIAEMVTLSEVLGGMGEFMAASETESLSDLSWVTLASTNTSECGGFSWGGCRYAAARCAPTGFVWFT